MIEELLWLSFYRIFGINAEKLSDAINNIPEMEV